MAGLWKFLKIKINVDRKVSISSCFPERMFSISSGSRSRTSFHDYELMQKTFHLEQPTYFNFVKDCFQKWVVKKPTSTALWWTDDFGKSIQLSFAKMDEISSRLSHGLEVACGLKKGDRVVVILPRILEWWYLNLSCIRSGIVICPGTILLTKRDIASRLEASNAKAIVVGSEKMSLVDEVCEEYPHLKLKKICVTKKRCSDSWYKVDDLIEKGSPVHECVSTLSDETMMLFFTSGTTGLPKMAEHTHASYGLGHVITGRFWLDLTDKDVMWANSDTGWAKSAWSNVFAPWCQGASIFVHHTSGFDPATTLRVMERFPITTFCTVPTAYRLLLQENLGKFKAKSLAHCVSAGEPLNAEMLESWRSHTDLTIYEGYGQTETVLVCGSFKCVTNKPGSMGRSSPGFDVKVVDDDGKVVDKYAEGNLAISVKPNRPVGLFKGYLGDDERTRSVFVGDFYLTGDRAYCDEEDYFWFVGRSDDVILSSGYRIGPFEVESALHEHNAVLESAVVSSPDEQRGEVVKAYVILKEVAKSLNSEVLKQELKDHVKSITAPYKYPRKIEFVENLPKTVSGKIRRVELRQKEWNT